MNEAPKKIWLQTGCDESECNGDCLFNELGDVTWCEHEIHRDDTPYIRADIVDELVGMIHGYLDVTHLDELGEIDGRAVDALEKIKEEE